MRKIFLLLGLAVTLLLITACSSIPKASKPLEAFLTAYRSEPLEQEMLQPYFDTDVDFTSKLQVYENGNVNEELYTKLAEVTRDFTYEKIGRASCRERV